MKKFVIIVAMMFCLGIPTVFAGETNDVTLRAEKVKILIEHYQGQRSQLEAEYQIVLKNLRVLLREQQAIQAQEKPKKKGKKKKK